MNSPATDALYFLASVYRSAWSTLLFLGSLPSTSMYRVQDVVMRGRHFFLLAAVLQFVVEMARGDIFNGLSGLLMALAMWWITRDMGGGGWRSGKKGKVQVVQLGHRLAVSPASP